MDKEQIFAGLNAEQRRAVGAVRGPVCILAGAGSGKTTTITRRIANQVASGAFSPGSILAVTFTDKAAGEMRERLEILGTSGVRARTFHSAALAQLHHLAETPPGQILPSKGMALRQIANTLPKPYRFRPAADLASEIEWARNRRIRPDNYEASLGGHEPPIPSDLMKRVFAAYEDGKRNRNLIDFEDVLELTISMFENDDDARMRFQSKYQAFTVDEYQDVNLLQQTVLDHWLGDRDDLCVVGDDYQSIYAFTGATADHLLKMPSRFPRTTVVRLEENHRSTPQILETANLLVPDLGGAEKTLTATKPAGPEVVVEAQVDEAAERTALAKRVAELHSEGLPYEDIAILYRTNFRSEDYEEALTEGGIPFQVRDGAFLSRRAAQRILNPLRTNHHVNVEERVIAAAVKDGWVEHPPEGLGDREMTRQNDLARLVRLAAEFDDGERSCAEFVVDLEKRFGSDGDGRGVNLLTYHRAKGLEFEAVFLPRLNEGDIPFRRSKTADAIAEERRLLYVGITRAKTHLFMTWTTSGKDRPSRFLEEMGVAGQVRSRSGSTGEVAPFAATANALKAWRKQRSGADAVPAYVVFSDATLEEIASRLPRSEAELLAVPGIGLTKLERYGKDVLRIVAETAT